MKKLESAIKKAQEAVTLMPSSSTEYRINVYFRGEGAPKQSDVNANDKDVDALLKKIAGRNFNASMEKASRSSARKDDK